MNREEQNLKTQRLWRELHKSSRHRTKYPVENVVRFIFKNFKRDRSEKILDLGCGAGRHVIFMANENIIPYGLDFSQEGVEYTQNVLKEMDMEEYAENIQVGSVTDIPFEEGMFDGLLCIGVLCYMGIHDIRSAASEIHRVLRDGGKAMILVRSIRDYRCQSPDSIPTEEKNTFIIEENDTGKSANKETGMLMHFCEREELEQFFSRFHNVVIDRVTVTHENESYADDDYLITCVK